VDAVDRKILAILQNDGRTSVTDLATQVGLSLSACHRRVKDLEQSGSIRGYRAVIAPASLGLGFEAIAFVTIGPTNLETIAAFEAAVAALPNIIDAERLFGEPDYILRILVRDLESYKTLYDESLGTLPGVQRLTTTIVMTRFGPERAVPIF
jgi:DNA-binding Lrp family transcriptional regulator